MTRNENGISNIWKDVDNIKFVAPLLGLGFALLINFGYFSAFGLGWFSFLSLSEHTVLALQSLPVGIQLVVLFYGTYFLDFASSGFAAGRTPRTEAIWAIFLSLCFVSAAAVALFYVESYHVTVILIVFYVIVMITRLGFRIRKAPQAIGVFSLMATAAIAFSYGLDRAQISKTPPYPYILREKGGYVVEGMLLAIGDRGVLFFNAASKNTELRRWEGVQMIERKPVSPRSE